MVRLTLIIIAGVFSVTSFIYPRSQFIFENPPENFKPVIEVSACYIDVDQHVLFLKRQPYISEGNTWGVPAGKIKKVETPEEAVIRETKEETGLEIQKNQLISLGKVYVRYPQKDFVFHMFTVSFEKYPSEILIEPTEHSEYRWLTLKEALELPLIPGEDECLYLIYKDVLAKTDQNLAAAASVVIQKEVQATSLEPIRN